MLQKGGKNFLFFVVLLVTLLFPFSFVRAAGAFTSVNIIEFVTSTPPEGGAPSFDRVPPLILDVRIKRVARKSVEISWDTNELTESYFALGFTNNYELGEKHLPDFALTHRVVLSELEFNQKYLFRIVVIDHGGNTASSFNFFILVEPDIPQREPNPDPVPPVPVPPHSPLPDPEPSPEPPHEPGELPENPIPRPPRPIISVPPAEPPVIISHEESESSTSEIITDTSPSVRYEQTPRGTVYQTEKGVSRPNPQMHQSGGLAQMVKKVYFVAARHPFLLVPNKIFAVPDLAYGPFLLSLIFFILSLFL